MLSDAENEKKKVVSEARKTADEEYQRIVADAHKTAAQIKDDAEAEAVMQKEQILKKAEKEIADIHRLKLRRYSLIILITRILLYRAESVTRSAAGITSQL